MNVNIILDSDYICEKLSEGKEVSIDYLFTYFKNKSNIIIIQDNEQNLIRNIVRHEKINEQNIKNTEIFLTSLINGTNKFDYTIKEKYENDFIAFIKNLKNQDYPLQIVISDKEIDSSVKTFLLEDFDAIAKAIEKYSQRHKVTDNEILLNKENDSNVTSHNEYEKILFNTFWCSSKITLIAKEFFEATVLNKKNKEMNQNTYSKGLDIIIKILNKIEDLIEEKVELEIISGVSDRFMNDFKMKSKSLTDEAFEFLSKIDPRFKLTILHWNPGNESSIGEGHGRRIYSDFGGLETEYPPYELFNNKLEYKDMWIQWIGDKEHLNLQQYMNTLAKRQGQST